jgi:DNA-binding NarL/FixJ family response regulator
LNLSLEHDVGRATSSAQLPILLVADPLVRIALKQLLREADEVVVVGEAAADQALPVARGTAPDVALVDAQSVNTSLSEFLQQLRAVSPKTRPIVLSQADFEVGLLRIADVGAWGYLPRDVSESRLVQAVRLVARGKVVMDCTMAHDEFTRLGQLRPADPPNGTAISLSQKEASVMRVMAEGHTDSQIAKQLGLSVPTVKTHVRAILRKTNSRNRAAAVATAFRSGTLK